MFAFTALLLGLGCGSRSEPPTTASEAPQAPVAPWVLKVNGVALGATREQVVAAFGEPGPSPDGKTDTMEYKDHSVGFGGWQTVGNITFVLKDLSLNTILLATHPTLDAGADPVAMMAAVGAAIFKGADAVPPVQIQWLNKPQWRYKAPLRTVVTDGGAAPAVVAQEGSFTMAQLVYDDGKPLLMAVTSTSAEFAKELRVDSLSALPQPPHVGDPLDVGGARMVIAAIVPTKQVGMKAMPRKASEGASWIVVRYVVENTGNDTTLGVPGNDMHIQDAAGRTFRASGDGTTELALAEGLDLIVTQLQPGIAKPLVQVFEVPDTVLGNLTLVVPHGNPLTGQQYTLALDLD